jgi:hypothetical protein
MTPDTKKPADIAVKVDTALSIEMAGMFAQAANAGLENVRPEDLVIPFVVIIQKNSPQVDDASGKYLEGAKVGMFFESGTLTAYDEIDVIPCDYRTCIVEWHPRETGGGFVGQHEVGYEQQFQPNDRGGWVTDAGTVLIWTMYFNCLLILPEGDTLPVVISFTSSQLKKARTWVTRLTTKRLKDAAGKKFQPPIYESVWHLSTVPEENEKGSWRGFKIEPLKQVDSMELFKAAQKARAMFQKKEVIKPAEVVEGEQ